MKSNKTGDLDIEMAAVDTLRGAFEKATESAGAHQVAEKVLTHFSRQFRTGLNNILNSAKLLDLRADDNDRENIQKILAAGQELLGLLEEKMPCSEGEQSVAQSISIRSTASRCDVLYVEDNDANFRLVRRILERRPDISLLRADRGEVGVTLAREHCPRLILLDLNLPDIPGTEVFQRVRAQPETQSIPIVVISADATPSQIERLLTMGARNYLTKPFNIQRFLAVVEEILEEEATLS